MQHFDLAKVMAACDKNAAEVTALAEKDGRPGVLRQARMSLPTAREFMRVFTEEINRGATIDEIGPCVANVCSNIITAFAISASDGDDEKIRFYINAVFDGLAYDLNKWLANDSQIGAEELHVHPEPAGHA